MSNLKINGWSLPIAHAAAGIGQEDLGSAERADDGSLGTSRKSIKDMLTAETSWLRREAMQAIRGIVMGRGFRLSCDATAYTSRGQYPSTTPVISVRTSEIIAETTVLEYTNPKLGTGCFAVEAGTTNLLTAAQAEASATASFTALDAATLALDATTFRSGTNSLRVTTITDADAIRGGVLCAYTGVAGTLYAGSVYLRAVSGSPTVRVYLRDNTAATEGTKKTVTLSTTAWKRVEVTHTLGGASTALQLRIDENTTDVAIDFLCDQFQIEAKAHATSWVAGTTTRAAGSLRFPLTELRPQDDLTVMMWCRVSKSALDASAMGWLFDVGDGVMGVQQNVGAGTLVVTTVAGNFAAATVTGFMVDWTHVAMVMRRNPQSGSYAVELYINGVLGGSGSPTLPAFDAPTLYLGGYSGTPWNGLIDEVVVLPFGATAEQIAAWYLSIFSNLRELDVSGHLLNGADVEVPMVGEVTQVTIDAGIPSTALETVYRLGLKLREV